MGALVCGLIRDFRSQTMNQPNALKFAASRCYIYRKNPGQWVTVCPWKDSDLDGPKTESSMCYPYQRAQRLNAANIACCALFQWADARNFDREYIANGYEAILDAAHQFAPSMSARQFLRVGIDAAKRIQSAQPE